MSHPAPHCMRLLRFRLRDPPSYSAQDLKRQQIKYKGYNTADCNEDPNVAEQRSSWTPSAVSYGLALKAGLMNMAQEHACLPCMRLHVQPVAVNQPDLYMQCNASCHVKVAPGPQGRDARIDLELLEQHKIFDLYCT